jgi:nucleoside-diphosphate-sugar epimerase
MRVLVTGATGFVGQHLTSQLEELGHEVFVLVRNPKKLEKDFPVDRVVKIDLKTASPQKIQSKLPNELDCVIHTAGIVHSFSTQDFYEINTNATLNLYKSLNKNVHFIFLSSLAASGPSKTNKELTEADPTHPVSDYGRSKLKAEKELLDLNQSSLSSTAKLSILRPPMVVGPGDQGVLEIVKMIQSGIVITTGKAGVEKRYSYVSVYDLVRACLCLMRSPPEKPQLFFV